MRCEHVHPESEMVKSFRLRVLDDGVMWSRCEPGRYITLNFFDAARRLRKRNYSIIGRPGPDLVEIAVKREGNEGVSSALHESLTPNTLVYADGVSGDITVERIRTFGKVLMLAGGVGVTLPLALVRHLCELANRGETVPKVTLVVCVPRYRDLVFLTELLSIEASHSWFELVTYITRDHVRGDAPYFRPGRPSIDELKLIGQHAEALLICGSGEFSSSMLEMAETHFPAAQILIEAFSSVSRMAGAGEGAPDAGTVRVTVGNQGVTCDAPRAVSLLEILEENGVRIRSQCRSGICGSCRIRIVSGECRSEGDIALGTAERSEGYALACCTYPVGPELELLA
ncbi:hypothetical protein WI87_10170 [Burkholderia ubonensis]|nr:hypothetical protein WI87_10170 [Burkholderia ubonensis]KVT27914.1 hypothetical protein WK48_18215 [Burkholderia ubonensis]